MLSAMRSTTCRTAVLGAALAASALSLATPVDARRRQGGTPAPASTFTFRVLGENGTPVADLQPADVVLKVDGRPKEIRSLQLVRFDEPAPAAASPSPLPPPFATNVAPLNRRDLLLLVDEESMTSGREEPLRAALVAIIGGLSPADRASVISMRQGGINLPLTIDHARVRSSLSGIRAYGSGRETPTDLTCRTLRLLGTLETVFKSVGAGAPSTIVLFSASAAVMPASETARVGAETGSGLCQLRLDHFKQLTAAAQASRSDFYVMELMEVGGSQALPNATGGLENIAGAGGGDFSRLTGTGEAQMARIVRETSAHYMATFDADPSDRPGSTRRVDVSVTRPNVAIRARSDLAIPRAGARKGASPRDMLRTADAFSDLPLRSTAFSTRNAGDDKIK